MDNYLDSDSLVCLDEMLTRSEKERQAFFQQLEPFPNTFQLDQHLLGESLYKKMRACLESALSVGYQTTMETARARNLLAYLLFKLGLPEEALQQLDMVLALEGQLNNIVTLANKAIILRNEFQLSRADEAVAQLQQIRKESSREFASLVCRAKGELAFAYTRFGAEQPFAGLALKLFEEVIPQVAYKDPAKWLWMFGMALTKRRLLRVLPHGGLPPDGEMLDVYRDVLRLYLDLLEYVASANFRAKIYAEIAQVLQMVWRSELGRKEFSEMAGLTPEQACEIALKLDGEDNSVLCKCGRMYRYMRNHPKSAELLEKALSIRPSSTSYHHLGITFKLLATLEKRQSHPRPHSRNGAYPGYHDLARIYGNTADKERPDVQEQASASSRSRPLSPCKEVRGMQLVIKSPPNDVTKFTREDKYVKNAVENLEKAVAFSEGFNTRAVIDLAIFQRSLGELRPAREHLQALLKRKPPSGVNCTTDHVTIYDQLGSLLNELSEEEADEKRKQELRKDSNAMHLMALKMASKLLGKVPGVRDHIREIWDAFPSLLNDVETSSRTPHEKLQEKAILFQLIRDHKHLNLLQNIKQMDPERVHDPKYMKEIVENYMESQQYEEVLTFMELLGWNEEFDRLMQMFPEPKFLLQVCLRAARKALLEGTVVTAKDHFRTVFQETVTVYNDATSGSEDTSDAASEASSSRCKDDLGWDLIILHEDRETSRDKAEALANLLREACGLRVPILAEDQPINKLDLEGVLRMMRRSSMVVVMVGDRKVSNEMRVLIHNAFTRLSTVTLLAEGSHVPEMLRKAHRSMECPEHLFGEVKVGSDHSDKLDKAVVEAVCKVFSFLVNVPVTFA